MLRGTFKLLPIITLSFFASCGGDSNRSSETPDDRYRVQNPDRVTMPTLTFSLLTEVQDTGQLRLAVDAHLAAETFTSQTWEQLLGEPRLFLKIADLESLELQVIKNAEEKSLHLIPPSNSFLAPANFSKLYNATVSLLNSSQEKWTSSQLLTPPLLSPLTAEAPLSQRSLANCTPSGSTGTEASQLNWLNRNRNRIAITVDAMSTSTYEDLDDGSWRVGEGFLISGPGFFESIFSDIERGNLNEPVDDGFGGTYFESDSKVATVTLSRQLSKTVRLSTNPPVDLKVVTQVILKRRINAIYQGGCL